MVLKFRYWLSLKLFGLSLDVLPEGYVKDIMRAYTLAAAQEIMEATEEEDNA